MIVGLDVEPFSYAQNGGFVGLYVDIARRIFDDMGLEYEFQFNSWSDSLGMVREGKADVLMTASYDKNREEFISYTDDQIYYDGFFNDDDVVVSADRMTFFARKNDSETMEIRSFDEVVEKKFRVAVEKDMAYFPEFFNMRLNFYSFESIDDGIMELSEGGMDLVASERNYGVNAIEDLGLGDELGIVDWVLYEDPVYFAFAKNPKNIKLRDEFYERLVEMKKGGELDDLYEKYGVERWE